MQAISTETSSNFYAVLQIIFKKEKAREQVSSLACRQTTSPSNNLSDTKKLKSIDSIRLIQIYSITFRREKRFQNEFVS